MINIFIHVVQDKMGCSLTHISIANDHSRVATNPQIPKHKKLCNSLLLSLFNKMLLTLLCSSILNTMLLQTPHHPPNALLVITSTYASIQNWIDFIILKSNLLRTDYHLPASTIPRRYCSSWRPVQRWYEAHSVKEKQGHIHRAPRTHLSSGGETILPNIRTF